RPAGEFDVAAYLRRRGSAGELLLDRALLADGRRGGLAGAVDRVRARAERGVRAGLPAEERALLRGMVLGQDEAIAEPLREAFRASGLAHVLAVSGQNVMLLVALALPALALAGLGPGARAAALLALIALYVPLAGAGPSLQRAGVMGAAAIVAVSVARPSSRVYALLAAAVVTLALNPRSCGDPGWQLSFVAVGGIVWLAPSLRRSLAPAGRVVAEGAAITIAATLATAPVLGHHFGTVSLAALPANLLALPAVAPAMWLGMLKAAVAQIGAVSPALEAPAAGAAAVLGQLARLPVAYIAWLAERFAEMPGSRLQLPLASVPAVAGSYAALGIGAVWAKNVAGRLSPHALIAAARWRRLPKSGRAAAAAGCLAALALLAVRLAGAPSPPREFTVRFLDVGQGDATLVQHPDGAAVLFDGGPPEGGVAALLRRAGVRRLSAMVATHASRDHHGGLREVLERYPVGLLLDRGDGTQDPAFRALLRAADRRGVRRVAARAPLSLEAGGLSIRVLSPAPRPPGPAPEDPNPRAVVAVVSSAGFELLLSADAESPALEPLALPDVDAMKVPHHGSADPGLPALLRRLRPEVAAIEVGRNTYGHPTPSTLGALRSAGVRTYRTDRHGTVTLTVRGGKMRVESER
ncbi:MAG TPA: ComEC/Rec2 family competence protein, partial [Thermoleophilaceae bacterium]|nr:ComEC/Rec2 family competence protein [Thermoleophilaceae bacterium]